MFPARAGGSVSGFLHRSSFPPPHEKLRATAIAAGAFPSCPSGDHHRPAPPSLTSSMNTAASRSLLSPPRASSPLLSLLQASSMPLHLYKKFPAEVAVTADANVQVLNRKLELDQIYSKLGEKITRIFIDYMTKVTEFEELADVGKRFLTGFHRVTEMFRTVELQKTSNNISRIIDANWNEHMKTYVEAGCKQQSQSVQNMYNLHSCVLGLQDNLKNAEALLNELDCLKEDAIAVTEAATKSATALDDSFCEEMLKDLSFEEEKEPFPKHPQDTSISEVMLMKIISDMLKLDYAMQKNIVLNLNIGTSVSELEGYCLVWNLHPYIDDDIMHRAWRYVPSRDQSSQ